MNDLAQIALHPWWGLPFCKRGYRFSIGKLSAGLTKPLQNKRRKTFAVAQLRCRKLCTVYNVVVEARTPDIFVGKRRAPPTDAKRPGNAFTTLRIGGVQPHVLNPRRYLIFFFRCRIW